MHAILAAFGRSLNGTSTSATVNKLWPKSHRKTIESNQGAISVTLVATDENTIADSIFESEIDGVQVVLDGYLLMEGFSQSRNQKEHLRAFAEVFARAGVAEAQRSVIAGVYNLIIVDNKRRRHFAVSDALGVLPLYYLDAKEVCLVSTSPVAIAHAFEGSLSLDRTACAELTVVGYTIGGRCIAREMRRVDSNTILSWNANTGTSFVDVNSRGAWGFSSKTKTPTVDEISDRLRSACSRLVDATQLRFAHFLSGGMDSRAILASWPTSDLPCYSYGPITCAEVTYAKQSADQKRAPFQSIEIRGDAIAEILYEMFNASGALVFPHRYITAREMRNAGVNAALDGFLGDVLLGGTYYRNDAGLSTSSSILRLLTIFKDQKVSRIGLDRLAEFLYLDICTIPDTDKLRALVSDDFVADVAERKDDILQDIVGELVRLRPQCDSVAILIRNFLMANRGRHDIAQQGVMSRCHVHVCYPFTNDQPLFAELLMIPPEASAYRRFYIQLFRKCFPNFAQLQITSTKMPLASSPLRHKWQAILSSRRICLPGPRGAQAFRGSPADWGTWLNESAALRDEAVRWLNGAGIESPQLLATLAQWSSGLGRGAGQLFHMCALARWLKMLSA